MRVEDETAVEEDRLLHNEKDCRVQWPLLLEPLLAVLFPCFRVQAVSTVLDLVLLELMTDLLLELTVLTNFDEDQDLEDCTDSDLGQVADSVCEPSLLGIVVHHHAEPDTSEDPDCGADKLESKHGQD